MKKIFSTSEDAYKDRGQGLTYRSNQTRYIVITSSQSYDNHLRKITKSMDSRLLSWPINQTCWNLFYTTTKTLRASAAFEESRDLRQAASNYRTDCVFHLNKHWPFLKFAAAAGPSHMGALRHNLEVKSIRSDNEMNRIKTKEWCNDVGISLELCAPFFDFQTADQWLRSSTSRCDSTKSALFCLYIRAGHVHVKFCVSQHNRAGQTILATTPLPQSS